MEENGQIHVNTNFGYMLYMVACDPAYKTYLEVGTWKGNGSTKCIMEGLAERTEDSDIRFHSFETNHSFFLEALELWRPKCHSFLTIHNAKLHSDGLMAREEIEAHPMFEDVFPHYELWYDQDVEDYAKAPYINPASLATTIDVIILDGGEFSGYADWEALKPLRPSVVCLDDTCTMKNEKVYKELANSTEWDLWQEGKDRNGWAIFKRASASASTV